MNNDLTNEINAHRMHVMGKFTHRQIDDAVLAALGSGRHGFEGLSSEDDGITHTLWVYAVDAAFQNGDLAMCEADQPVDPDWEPAPFSEAVKMVARRVTAALFALHAD